MTKSEWRIVKFLGVLVLVTALLPLSALVYRLATDEGGTGDVWSRLFAPEAPAALTVAPAPALPTGSASASVPPVAEDGKWTEYSVSDQGFAISIPESWQRLPMNPNDLNTLLNSTRAQNPELANSLGANAQSLIQNGIRFWAYDADPAAAHSGMATTLTVLKRTLPSPVSLETYVQVNTTQISSIKTRVGALSSDRVRLNDLPASRLRYTISFARPDGTSALSFVTQYLLLNNADAFVIGFATPPDLADHYEAVFTRAAASFRLLP